MYEVIVMFYDMLDFKQTKGGKIYHRYDVGDKYPRDGAETTDARIAELTTDQNKRGTPLIRLIGADTQAVAETPAEPVQEKPKRKRKAVKKDVGTDS